MLNLLWIFLAGIGLFLVRLEPASQNTFLVSLLLLGVVGLVKVTTDLLVACLDKLLSFGFIPSGARGSLIGFATSIPEIFVILGLLSAISSEQSSQTLELLRAGAFNVLGSNIVNAAGVIGIASTVLFLRNCREHTDYRPRLEAGKVSPTTHFFYFGSTCLMLLPILLLERIPHWVAFLGAGSLIVYFFTVFQKSEDREKNSEPSDLLGRLVYRALSRVGNPVVLGIFTVLGLASTLVLLSIASDAFVTAGVVMGARLGLEASFVGAFFFGFGTSLPELASCIKLVVEGDLEDAVTEVTSSNIFNVLAVLSLLVLGAPQGILFNQGAVMATLVAAPALLVFFPAYVFTNEEVSTKEGFCLLLQCVCFTWATALGTPTLGFGGFTALVIIASLGVLTLDSHKRPKS